MSMIKILVVQDNPIISKEIKRNLHNLGYSITSIVPSGKEALEKTAEESSDLVLLDIDFKSYLKGIKTARQIRERFAIPIVYITDCLSEKKIDSDKITESFYYVCKPIDEKELCITIKTALSIHTQLKKLKEELSESEKRYSLLVNHMNEGVLMQDEKGLITFVNDRLLEMSGYTQEDVIGHLFTEFFGEVPIKKFRKQKTRREKDIYDTCIIEWKRKNGQGVSTSILLSPIYDKENDFKGSIAVFTDITEFRQIEKKLNKSKKELHNLYRHLHSVKEKESKRIAREIHDELGQALTALKIELFWLANKLSKSDKNQKLFLEKIKSMSELIDTTVRRIQRIASELRPGILDDLGLVPAIEWQAQDFENRTRIKCITKLDLNGVELDPDCSTAIFRIFQEALTNVARHAEATEVKVRLKDGNSKLEIKISDNGRGIAESDILSPNSLGLIGMRERLRAFDGKLKLHSAPNRGTTLAIILPINKCKV